MPRENSSHRGSAPCRAVQEDLPCWLGLPPCEAVLVFSGQRFRGWPVPRGVASHFPLRHCAGICRIHELESNACASPKEKVVCLLIFLNYPEIMSFSQMHLPLFNDRIPIKLSAQAFSICLVLISYRTPPDFLSPSSPEFADGNFVYRKLLLILVFAVGKKNLVQDKQRTQTKPLDL